MTNDTTTTRNGPLAGLRCLSLAQNVPGPMAAQILRAEGMEITKIEPPQGDMSAAALPTWYQELSQGVTIETCDLRHQDGQDRLHALLSQADLLITSHRRGALARLGLTPEALAARHPQLCWVEIVGDTEAPDIPGHDLTYQAAAGLLSPPDMPRTLIADLGGAQAAATAAMALLFGRERGQSARHRAVGLAQSAAFFATPLRHGVTGAKGLLGGAYPPYRIYALRDGWAAVAAVEPHFTQRMHDHLGQDPTARLQEMTQAEVAELAQTQDIPITVFSDHQGEGV